MIYICLLNYKGARDTVECLESLGGLEPDADVRIVIVDNASPVHGLDEVSAWLAEHADRLAASPIFAKRDEPFVETVSDRNRRPSATISLIQSDTNDGFATGNNIALRYALNDPDCTHAWLLNNDTVVDPAAVRTVLERLAADPDIGLCGSTLVYYDARDTTQALGGALNVATGRLRQIGGELKLSDLPPTAELEREMGYVAGAAMMATRAFLDAVGLLNERYFLYCEEIDWATRGLGQFKLGWARDSIVFHKEGAAIGTSSRQRASNTALYYLTNSNLVFMWTYHRGRMPVLMARQAAIAGRYILRRDVSAVRVMASAIWDFARGHRRTGAV